MVTQLRPERVREWGGGIAYDTTQFLKREKYIKMMNNIELSMPYLLVYVKGLRASMWD